MLIDHNFLYCIPT